MSAATQSGWEGIGGGERAFGLGESSGGGETRGRVRVALVLEQPPDREAACAVRLARAGWAVQDRLALAVEGFAEACEGDVDRNGVARGFRGCRTRAVTSEDLLVERRRHLGHGDDAPSCLRWIEGLAVGLVPFHVHAVLVLAALGAELVAGLDDGADGEHLLRAAVGNDDVAGLELEQAPELVRLARDHLLAPVVELVELDAEGGAECRLVVVLLEIADLVPTDADVAVRAAVVPEPGVVAGRDLEDALGFAGIGGVVEQPLELERREVGELRVAA